MMAADQDLIESSTTGDTDNEDQYEVERRMMKALEVMLCEGNGSFEKEDLQQAKQKYDQVVKAVEGWDRCHRHCYNGDPQFKVPDWAKAERYSIGKSAFKGLLVCSMKECEQLKTRLRAAEAALASNTTVPPPTSSSSQPSMNTNAIPRMGAPPPFAHTSSSHSASFPRVVSPPTVLTPIYPPRMLSPIPPRPRF